MINIKATLMLVLMCSVFGCKDSSCISPSILNDINNVIIEKKISTVRSFVKNGSVIYDSSDNAYSNIVRHDNIIQWIEVDYSDYKTKISVVYRLYEDIKTATKDFDSDVSLKNASAIGNNNNRFAYFCPRHGKSDGEGGFRKFDYFLSGALIQKNNLLIQLGEISPTRENTHKGVVLKEVLKVMRQLSANTLS